MVRLSICFLVFLNLFFVGDYYVGDFLNDKRTGCGEIVYSGGDSYVGEFRESKFHGNGTYFWKNGEKWEGTFQENNRIQKKAEDQLEGDQTERNKCILF